MSELDLPALFSFTLNPLEIILRGSAIYWFLFLLFRFVLRRNVGSIAIADMLLLVMIADASQNAMAGDYKSITDGCLLVATLAAWNYLLDWASYRFPTLGKLVEPAPLLLIREGRPMRANMRRELVTMEELEARLREQGVAEIAEVSMAYLESDGEISVLTRDKQEGADTPKKPSRHGPPGA